MAAAAHFTPRSSSQGEAEVSVQKILSCVQESGVLPKVKHTGSVSSIIVPMQMQWIDFFHNKHMHWPYSCTLYGLLVLCVQSCWPYSPHTSVRGHVFQAWMKAKAMEGHTEAAPWKIRPEDIESTSLVNALIKAYFDHIIYPGGGWSLSQLPPGKRLEDPKQVVRLHFIK